MSSSLLRIALLAGVFLFALKLSPNPVGGSAHPLADAPHAGQPARSAIALSSPVEPPRRGPDPGHGG